MSNILNSASLEQIKALKQEIGRKKIELQALEAQLRCQVLNGLLSLDLPMDLNYMLDEKTGTFVLATPEMMKGI